MSGRSNGRERRDVLPDDVTSSVKLESVLAGYRCPWDKSLDGGGGDDKHKLLRAGQTADKGPAAQRTR